MKLQIGLNIQQNMDYLPTKFNNTAHINPPEMNGIWNDCSRVAGHYLKI